MFHFLQAKPASGEFEVEHDEHVDPEVHFMSAEELKAENEEMMKTKMTKDARQQTKPEEGKNEKQAQDDLKAKKDFIRHHMWE